MDVRQICIVCGTDKLLNIWSLPTVRIIFQKVDEKISQFLNVFHSNDIESWAQESRDLAMQPSVGYRDNELEVVTDVYMENHFDIINERIALGAIRLSQLLNKIFQDSN